MVPGPTVLFDRICELRPLFIPPDPASRTEYQPGELAQCDLRFPPEDVGLRLVGSCRAAAGAGDGLGLVAGDQARMLPSRQGPDLLAGQWALLAGWGRVPCPPALSAVGSRSRVPSLRRAQPTRSDTEQVRHPQIDRPPLQRHANSEEMSVCSATAAANIGQRAVSLPRCRSGTNTGEPVVGVGDCSATAIRQLAEQR